MDFLSARDYIRTLNFKNRNEFRKFIRLNTINIPSNPNYVYKDYWISMSDWLGKSDKSNKNLKKINYLDAVKKVKKILPNNINTKSKWIKFYELNINYFSDIPKNPNIVYKNSGWVSWSDWFGVESKSDPIKLNLEELLLLIEENEISNREQYFKLSKLLRIPTNPLSKYKLNSWNDILLKKIKKVKSFVDYETAKSIIKDFNIKSRSEWYKSCKLNKIPINIPKTPNKYYNEWVSWNDWLGHNITSYKKFIPYNEAIEYIKDLGITSLFEYYDYIISNSIDFLPLNPINYYKGNYKSSDDFLNFDKRISYGEKKIIKYLSDNSIDYIHQYIFDDCKYINKLKFDFYLPEYNTCLEFDGRQHFEPIEYFGGEDSFNLVKKGDNVKNLYCLDNNIKMIRISYEDINIIDDILNRNI
jgi:hypothetical protein